VRAAGLVGLLGKAFDVPALLELAVELVLDPAAPQV